MIDLANRGPLRSFTPPSYLSSLFLLTPLLTSFFLLFLPSIVCPARSNDGDHMLNRRCGLLLVLLFPLILTFLFPLSFHPGGLFEVSLPLPLVGSIISLGPGPPLFVCSASVGSLCSRGLVLEPTTASSSREVCASACMYLCVLYFFSLFFNHMQPSLPLLCGQGSARLALKCSQSSATQGRQKTGT